MECPRCPEEQLVADTVAGTEVDRCGRCRGVWLDRGEGEAVTRPDTPVPAEVVQRATADTRQTVLARSIGCPRCGRTMRREKYANSLVVIDRCDCGVWLDGGELEKIQAYRRRRLEEIASSYGDVDSEALERTYARAYFDLGHGG